MQCVAAGPGARRPSGRASLLPVIAGTARVAAAVSSFGRRCVRPFRSGLMYLVLVGGPLLGLLGILALGEELEAPPEIAGAWHIERPPAWALEGSCAPPSFADGLPEFTIFQSGRSVELVFHDVERTLLVGRIKAQTLTARQVRASSGQAAGLCGDTMLAVLQLQLRRQARGVDLLNGAWIIPECAACSALPMRAVRRAAP